MIRSKHQTAWAMAWALPVVIMAGMGCSAQKGRDADSSSGPGPSVVESQGVFEGVRIEPGITFCWADYDGVTKDDPEEALFILDGYVMGRGIEGFANAMDVLESKPAGLTVYAFSLCDDLLFETFDAMDDPLRPLPGPACHPPWSFGNYRPHDFPVGCEIVYVDFPDEVWRGLDSHIPWALAVPLEEILELLHSGNPRAALVAIDALRQRGDASVIGELEPFLNSECGELQEAARAAIDELQNDASSGPTTE
jgi:hypothetical protein